MLSSLRYYLSTRSFASKFIGAKYVEKTLGKNHITLFKVTTSEFGDHLPSYKTALKRTTLVNKEPCSADISICTNKRLRTNISKYIGKTTWLFRLFYLFPIMLIFYVSTTFYKAMVIRFWVFVVINVIVKAVIIFKGRNHNVSIEFKTGYFEKCIYYFISMFNFDVSMIFYNVLKLLI